MIETENEQIEFQNQNQNLQNETNNNQTSQNYQASIANSETGSQLSKSIQQKSKFGTVIKNKQKNENMINSFKKPIHAVKAQNELEKIHEEIQSRVRNIIPTPKSRYNALQPLNVSDEKSNIQNKSFYDNPKFKSLIGTSEKNQFAPERQNLIDQLRRQSELLKQGDQMNKINQSRNDYLNQSLQNSIEEEEDELQGRSICQEIDYQDRKKAQKQIQHANLEEIQKQKQRKLLKLDQQNILAFNQKEDDVSNKSFAILSYKSKHNSTNSRYNNSVKSQSLRKKFNFNQLKQDQISIENPKFLSNLNKSDENPFIQDQDQQKPQTLKNNQQFETFENTEQKNIYFEKLLDYMYFDKITQNIVNHYRIQNGLQAIDVKAFNSAQQFRKNVVELYSITLEQIQEALLKFQEIQEGLNYQQNENANEKKQNDEQLIGINAIFNGSPNNQFDVLLTQKKKLFYPTMADSSQEFSKLALPATQYQKHLNRQKYLEANSENKMPQKNTFNNLSDKKNTFMTPDRYSVDLSERNPLNQIRKSFNQTNNPAGMRIPKNFELTFGEKIPMIIKNMKEKGANISDIKKTMNKRLNAQIENYVNKSNVGAIMVMDDEEIDFMNQNSQENNIELQKQKFILNELYLKQLQLKNAQNYNKAQIQNKEIEKMRNKFKLINSSVLSLASGTPQTTYSWKNSLAHESNWSTTSKDAYQPKEIQDFANYRKNFKKKTAFIDWQNALFGHGVFFNPPVSEI